MVPVIERYFSDYRRVFIEHPRVRLDGVYIATCHYMYVASSFRDLSVNLNPRRAGVSEISWVNVGQVSLCNLACSTICSF